MQEVSACVAQKNEGKRKVDPAIVTRLQISCPCALTEHHAMKAYWGSGGIGRSTNSYPLT